MRTFKTLAVLLVAVFAIQAMGQSIVGKIADAKTGTDVGTTLCYAILSGDGGTEYYENGSSRRLTPFVTFLSATTDKSTAITFRVPDGNVAVASGANTTTSCPVAATNGFAANDVVIIRHQATDTYERAVLGSFATNNAIVLAANPGTAMAAGDLIYRVAASGTIPINNTTANYYGDIIYSGKPGVPLMVDIDGTSACQINAVCATYK